MKKLDYRRGYNPSPKMHSPTRRVNHEKDILNNPESWNPMHDVYQGIKAVDLDDSKLPSWAKGAAFCILAAALVTSCAAIAACDSLSYNEGNPSIHPQKYSLHTYTPDTFEKYLEQEADKQRYDALKPNKDIITVNGVDGISEWKMWKFYNDVTIESTNGWLETSLEKELKPVDINAFRKFIANDLTHNKYYINGTYMCLGFFEDFNKNATREGIPCYLAVVETETKSVLHALVAFYDGKELKFYDPKINIYAQVSSYPRICIFKDWEITAVTDFKIPDKKGLMLKPSKEKPTRGDARYFQMLCL